MESTQKFSRKSL